MTSINSFAAGSYVSDRTAASLAGLKSRLDGLTTQLSTGRVADTYGGLGSARTASLSAHSAISALDGYTAAITNATTRVTLAATSLTQVKTLGDSLKTSLASASLPTTGTGVTTTTTLARSNLDAALDALNQSVAGQYIFAGRETETAPVISADVMLDGNASMGLAGIKTLIAEQKSTDGVDGTGRLGLTQAPGVATVALSENANAEVRANFGFTIQDAISSNPTSIAKSLSGTGNPVGGEPFFTSFTPPPADGDRFRVAVTLTDGSQKIVDLTARNPATGADGTFAIDATSATNTATNLKTALGNLPIASIQSSGTPPVSLDFSSAPAARSLALTVSEAAPPVVGDKVTITLGLHDGTTKTVTLTAASAAAPGAFVIDTTGANAADRAVKTAENLRSALGTALSSAATTELAASSSMRASQNFFDGSSSPGLAPRRVAADGNGYAKSEIASRKTVIWYTGDDGGTDPRSTASVQVGANRSVSIGARANEAPLRQTLAAFAALAVGGFADATGAQNVALFQATADRAKNLVTPVDGRKDVADLVGEFGVAANGMADAKAQARSTKAALQDSLDGVETVSTEEVAAKLLTLQTQLQASYQVTSMLSKLSLVNYIS
ncbi:MAG: hypothetical protein ABW179_02845 [Methylobacterium sp.]